MVSFDLPGLQKEDVKIRTNRVQRDPARPSAKVIIFLKPFEVT